MNVPGIQIERIDGDRTRDVARFSGCHAESELTVRHIGAELSIADRSNVLAKWRGRGVAHALVGRLVTDARASARRVAPVSAAV